MAGYDGTHQASAEGEYRSVTEEIQKEIDRRYDRLKARAEHPLL